MKLAIEPVKRILPAPCAYEALRSSSEARAMIPRLKWHCLALPGRSPGGVAYADTPAYSRGACRPDTHGRPFHGHGRPVRERRGRGGHQAVNRPDAAKIDHTPSR